MLTAGESRHGAEHQHGREGGQRADAGMSHEAAGIGIGGGGSGHMEIKRVDVAVQPLQQLGTVISPRRAWGRSTSACNWARPWRDHERRSEGQPLIQGDGVQAVFDHRPDANESESMFDERAQVAGRRIGNPNHGEAVVLQEIPEMPGVAAIGLGFAHDHRPDLRAADEERMPRRCRSAWNHKEYPVLSMPTVTGGDNAA